MPFEIYKGGGTQFLASSNPDIFIILIKYFLSAVYGFLTATITLALVKQGLFSTLNIPQVLILTSAFGLIHSLIFAAFQYYVAIEGLRPPILDESAKRLILETAIIEFVTGCLIGLISVIVVKFFDQPAGWNAK